MILATVLTCGQHAAMKENRRTDRPALSIIWPREQIRCNTREHKDRQDALSPAWPREPIESEMDHIPTIGTSPPTLWHQLCATSIEVLESHDLQSPSRNSCRKAPSRMKLKRASSAVSSTRSLYERISMSLTRAAFKVLIEQYPAKTYLCQFFNEHATSSSQECARNNWRHVTKVSSWTVMVASPDECSCASVSCKYTAACATITSMDSVWNPQRWRRRKDRSRYDTHASSAGPNRCNNNYETTIEFDHPNCCFLYW